MSTEKLELVVTARDEASKVLNGLTTKLKAASTGTGSLGASLGGMAVAGTAAIGVGTALGEAFKGAGEFLGQAAGAAMNEQVNIAKMTAALQANIPAWDGNTTAIEATIKKREDLAFSDDDLRQSLALLVTSTHDVNQAFQLQSIAMNLSRLRGTDLAETSTLLAKVNNGNISSLKRFGISLGDVSTKEEALAKLQALTVGQSEAYAQTTKGQFEAVSIAVQDANEDLGTHLLPTMSKFATVAKTDMVPAINSVVDGFGNILDFVTGNKSIQPHLDDLANRMGMVPKLMGDELIAGSDDLYGAARKSFSSILAAQQDMTDTSIQWGATLPKDIAGAMRSSKDDVKSAMEDLTYVMKHPLERAREQARIEGALSGKKLAAGLHSSDPAVRAQAEQTRQILIAKWEAITGLSWNAGYAGGNAFGRAWASGARNFLAPILRTIAGGGSGGSHVSGQHDFSGGGRATGGYVAPGGTYDVGEVAQERLHMFPGGGGYVVPTGGRREPMRPINVWLNGRLVGQLLDEQQGRELAMSSSYGYIRG